MPGFIPSCLFRIVCHTVLISIPSSEYRVPGTAMDYLHSGPINRCWYWSDIQIEEVLVPVEVVGSEESNF